MKPKAYIELETFFNLSGSEPLGRELTEDDVLDQTYTSKLIPHEVEILFWGNTIQFINDGVMDHPFVITVAFCREKKSGYCLEVKPTYLHFEKEL